MPNALAKLADLKNRLGTSSGDSDTLLNDCLAQASAQAATLAGVSSLLRQTATLYPRLPTVGGQSAILRLHLGPIESITSVKQRYDQTSAWSGVDALTEDTDFLVERLGSRLERINSVWYAPASAYIQVTGVFGYDDPADDTGGDSILPPDHLQLGVLEQAQWLWRRADKNGAVRLDYGMGGALDLGRVEYVASLKDAVRSLPFVRLL
jgi:hypothetical protein